MESAKKQYIIQALLFLLTLVCTTLAGAEWIFGKSVLYGDSPLTWSEFWYGLHFSLAFLGILTVHEFGHYFTAKYYKVSVSLPYYIPLWLGFMLTPSIGTAGAFIRINERIRRKKEIFDIGIAGPLAGFVVALGVLYYGFTNLPPAEYIFEIHPEYQQYGLDYDQHVYGDDNGHGLKIALGKNLLFTFFEKYIASDPNLIPNKYEMYHYPYLFAGFLALFFTALNLLPIGQLDGGHVLYGLLGYRRARIVSRLLFVLLVFLAGTGILRFSDPPGELAISIPLYTGFLYLVFYRMEPFNRKKRLLYSIAMMLLQTLVGHWVGGSLGFEVYLLFCLLLGRVLGVEHPPAIFDDKLSTTRKVLGWIALIVFIISFTPAPLTIE